MEPAHRTRCVVTKQTVINSLLDMGSNYTTVALQVTMTEDRLGLFHADPVANAEVIKTFEGFLTIIKQRLAFLKGSRYLDQGCIGKTSSFDPQVLANFVEADGKEYRAWRQN